MPTRKKNPIVRVLVFMLFVACYPALLLADEKGKDEAPKSHPAKMEAPAPLTERERWLLDRVELLEKRVAELETKSDRATAPGMTEAGQPVRASAVATPTSETENGVSRAAVPAAAATPDVNTIAKNSANAEIGPQATEKGKSGAAQPEKAEPFAFADFTWLNGNARTK